jgi:hypothetical protein
MLHNIVCKTKGRINSITLSSGGCITYKYPSRISGFDLGAEIGRLVESSLAANTRDAYQTGVLNFETFRVDYELAQSWPPPIPHVALFIAFLSLNLYCSN